jgi:DNA-binding CsgD family transcriptional regulator
MLFNESYTYSDIANEMFINSKTVSKHASNIFKKTKTKNRKDFLEALELKPQQIENQTFKATT